MIRDADNSCKGASPVSDPVSELILLRRDRLFTQPAIAPPSVVPAENAEIST